MSSSIVKMSGDTSGNKGSQTCGICDINPSKYCCPRCEVFYCSLDCYKSEKHQQCSEGFYRDCVNEELASHQAGDESKAKMIDILKRMQSGDFEDPENMDELLENLDEEDIIDSDDEDYMALKDRLNGLNLDDADAVWDALTEDERNEFEALMSKGDVDAILPKWEPWWTYTREEKLVEDVESKDEEVEIEHLKKCPIIINVPDFSNLSSVKPSPAIKCNLTNVIASYAFIMRYFNGELDPVEGATYLLNICANLDTNANFDDPATAVEAVSQNCLKSSIIETDKASLEVMKYDTFLIIKGPSPKNKVHYLCAALSHLQTVLVEAKRGAKPTPKEKPAKESSFSKKYPERSKEYLDKLDVSKVKKCIKKIEYYIAYVKNYGLEFE